MGQNEWPGVEVRHLTALQAVAREGSFGRAAIRLGYTQSAISGQIAALERIVGTRLLDRPPGARRVEPTRAGAVLLAHADAITTRLAAARAELAGLDGGRGALAVGIFQSVGARVVPEMLKRFARSDPGVRVELRERSEDATLLAELERGGLDLAFSIEPVRPAFVATRVLVDPWILAVGPGHELATAAAVSLEELERLPLAVFERCESQVRLEAALAARGARPNVVLRVEDARTMHSLVHSGVACALVPRLAVEPGDELVAITLEPEVPPRVIALARRRDGEPDEALERFAAHAVAVCAELDAPAADVREAALG